MMINNASDLLLPSPAQRYVQEPIAVVGLACRLPGNSDTPHALWELLAKGGVAKNEPPESRFDLNTHHDGSKKPNTMRSPGGMFLESIDPRDFDAQFFGISGTDAVAMDPQQRQLLEVVYECFENAGLSLSDINEAAFGCFVGSYAVDYADIQARDPEDRAPSITIGVGRALLSNRISHFLNIKGPSMTIDTACSGGLVSVDVACRYLQSREINGAIVAAANLYLNPEHNMDSGAMKGASSLSGKCHTFDIKADGYVKGEAVNAVILKRLDDAIRAGDPIRAVIRGSATNSDGRTPGIASPSSEAQATAIRAAYANAGITNFECTSYLECHGTGTQAGDPTEVAGISSVFAENRPAESPLIIGSIKSNVGHSEPAAGISGLMKAILAIENGIIPGNPTFITPNPKIDFLTQKVHATRTAIPWPKVDFRRASINSFGYGGSNAHIIVEEPGVLVPKAATHISSYMTDEDDFFTDEDISNNEIYTLVFSANDESSLQTYVKKIRSHLINPSISVNLPDLAYTLSERRTHHFNRAYIVTQTTNLAQSGFVFGKKSSATPKIGFIFTGQGAQWPQMGKDLVNAFPQARALLEHLDCTLQKTPYPPSWSLLDELTEPRSPELLRLPEFSQPLVTALQIVIIEILAEWNIKPQSVAGHSSGEIAAAYAAGFLTKENAIKAAFYRGQSARMAKENKSSVGMLAVGLGADDVAQYIEGYTTSAYIACYNSPNSVTLSGSTVDLEEVKTQLSEHGHFARMLLVNLAYHSNFMAEIGDIYQDFLGEDFDCLSLTAQDVKMFSSVLGHEMDRDTDSTYWKANMISPVRFEEAVRQMITGKESTDFLIEIGPSGALSGPIAQIKNSIPGDGTNILYCSAFSRGKESVKSMYDVAGRLFIAGAPVKLNKVNTKNTSIKPSVVIDLPNYSWNHSTKYWYENEASKDWRNRLFLHHDLLGSKILGTSWHTPSFKKTLRVKDLPWLRDHKLGPEIVFPAAGFISMAVEAISQRERALFILEEKAEIQDPTYRIRDATFAKALVLEEDVDYKIMLTLSPRTGLKDSWYEYRVSSLTNKVWNEHSRGLVRIEENIKINSELSTISPLELPTFAQEWYKAMNDTGYNFGPSFQKQLNIEAVSGKHSSRSTVSFVEPSSTYPQSFYPLHPACIDGCLQSCAPSLWKGNRTAINAVLVPAIIDDIYISTKKLLPETAISISSSRYAGVGRQEDPKSFMSEASVYDPESGDVLFKVSGLRYHKLDTREDSYAAHNYGQVYWKPDVTHFPHKALQALENSGKSSLESVNEIIDLIAHKKPNLKVLETNSYLSNSKSLWLDGAVLENPTRRGCLAYTFSSNDAKALIEAQNKYSSEQNISFELIDITKSPNYFQFPKSDFDLVIVRVPTLITKTVINLVENSRSLLAENGHLLLLDASGSSTPNSIWLVDGEVQTSSDKSEIISILSGAGFHNTTNLIFADSGDIRSAYLSAVKSSRFDVSPAPVNLVRFKKESIVDAQIKSNLEIHGLSFYEVGIPFDGINYEYPTLILDDLSSPLLPTIEEEQWESLKHLTTLGSRILWVTEGSQINVKSPDKAMIHGLARTVRAEDPSVSLTTLDVENASEPNTVFAIIEILKHLREPRANTYLDDEYVERDGVILVSRIQPDHLINRAEKEDTTKRNLKITSLHDAKTTIRLGCERLGTVDSLCYLEVDPKELPLGDGCVEVELVAAGLNFKDVAVTMGIVPENQYLLGLEGAGTIKRLGRNTSPYKIGQRVLVFEKGTFGNRIIATTERVYALPDNISFEEASTIPGTYLPAMYSIFDLAQTKKGSRVLIHSASGGLGIASIQLCHYLGAEVFATVGNMEKRRFLTDTFGIPSDHIFDSRSTAFAPELMRMTNYKGVDVILNTLIGDILEESWRCIASGGTMVELGKKDILDRNYLSMEPFGRNASYRSFDLSHKHVSDKLIARLLGQVMKLLEKGHISPITPIKVFHFEDILSAFRYMRGAKHIGKIVISSEGYDKIEVPVRPAAHQLVLRDDVSYLLVGGLKGLLGSVSIQLARMGAKHLIVLARSGYRDEKSQLVLKNLHAEGCQVSLVTGDVSVLEDVRRTFKTAIVKIGGVIQGAMVLRDKLFSSMTIRDYHDTTAPKVQGTWNIHNVALEENLSLDFFTMLSSISGIVGQKGQANYAAANAFLDSFAWYRQKQGLAACSVDLGAVEDVGYISDHKELLGIFNATEFTTINERLLLKIIRVSIIQQLTPINSMSAQLITGIAIPQQPNSTLLMDARFCSLNFTGSQTGIITDSKDGSKEIQALFLMLRNGADPIITLKAVVEIVSRQFITSLRLSDPMEPGKPLSSYGIDSLTAVEFRNWVRIELRADLTTLEITNAPSLISLCEKIISKILVVTAAPSESQ